MSAANTNVAPAHPAPVTSSNFWEDNSIELNDQRIKKEIPKLPVIEQDFQVVVGDGIECLAYLMWQIRKSNDRVVILRALASAVSIILKDKQNYTGSRMAPKKLEGLAVAADPNTSPETVLVTNFEDEESVTVGELLSAMEADSDEIGSYFGVLFLAGNKKITNDNRSSFNERRKQAAIASVIGDACIFVSDSPWLEDRLVAKMYAVFLSCAPMRANMTSLVVRQLEKPLMGTALAFINMFLLTVDVGMNALRIIKEAVLKHPWIHTDYPELKPEFHAANEGQNIIKRAPGRDRSFLKAIHGNAFVPVNYSEIDNLLGVCKEVLKRTTPSYQNYNGGKITESQLQRLNARLAESNVVVATVAAE